jgi:peptidyl-prolyl cis-trans isomerase D
MPRCRRIASDSVKDKNNTQAIDVGNSTLIAARVTDYKPAAVPALDTIKDAVKQKYIAEQSADLARKDGAAKLADLQKSKSTGGFSPELKVSRSDAQGVPPAVLSAVFKADAQKLPTYVGVDLGADGYAIYRVNAVLPGPAIDAQKLAAAQQQIAQSNAQLEMQAYVDSLRARSKVKLYGNLGASQSSGE